MLVKTHTKRVFTPEELFQEGRRSKGLVMSVHLRDGTIISGPVVAVVDQTIRIGQRMPIHFDDMLGGQIESWSHN